jgi:hypothetical protein
MGIFELRPVSSSAGQLTPMWFDDESCTWDDVRLGKRGRLKESWTPPEMRLWKPARPISPVLYNPNALAVCDKIAEGLSACDELELLPVNIESHGVYFILHVVACVPISQGSEVTRAPANGGNVVTVRSFSSDYTSGNRFFRLLQPPDSPAGRQDYCIHSIYLNDEGKEIIEQSCSGFLYGKAVVDRFGRAPDLSNARKGPGPF